MSVRDCRARESCKSSEMRKVESTHRKLVECRDERSKEWKKGVGKLCKTQWKKLSCSMENLCEFLHYSFAIANENGSLVLLS